MLNLQNVAAFRIRWLDSLGGFAGILNAGEVWVPTTWRTQPGADYQSAYITLFIQDSAECRGRGNALESHVIVSNRAVIEFKSAIITQKCRQHFRGIRHFIFRQQKMLYSSI
jgi:hypothetical protein